MCARRHVDSRVKAGGHRAKDGTATNLARSELVGSLEAAIDDALHQTSERTDDKGKPFGRKRR